MRYRYILASIRACRSSERGIAVRRNAADLSNVRLVHRAAETVPAGGTRRLFGTLIAATVLPLLITGIGMFLVTSRQFEAQGLQQGRSEAALVARAVISPLLSGKPLTLGITPAERARLRRSVQAAIADGMVQRVRLRDLVGRAVWASDGQLDFSGDDEVVAASEGQAVALLTHLNSDVSGSHASSKALGPASVEAYVPVLAQGTDRRIGVLEVYLPYAPIAQHLDSARRQMTLALCGGLLVLWLALLAVAVRVGRRLRTSAVRNEYLATHDQLTDLPNRAEFTRAAANALATASPDRRTAVAVVDLDRFKEVNDTLGHNNGDVLLAEVARRLSARLRGSDQVARLGGDEFGILLPGVRDPGEMVEVLQRLRACLSEPVLIGEVPITVEGSVGFAMAPDDGVDADLLLTRADLAMYVAKRKHLGVVHYQPDQEQYNATTLTLIAELGGAIQRDELVLHYQPKADTCTGRITAVEALVRWQHPKRGLLYPDAFLFAAEQTELVEPLTRWVLRESLRTLPMLDPSGQLALAVNVSARSITRAEFADDVLAILAETGVDVRRLILEVTETALIADPRRAAATLSRLHEAGITLSIDDFGAGQTSLGYLATLPVSELKIDKDFVIAFDADVRNAAIVQSVIELGHSLGFTVTAEGVETEIVLDRLRAAHCDLVQGYLLARPMPADQVRQLLVRPASGDLVPAEAVG